MFQIFTLLINLDIFNGLIYSARWVTGFLENIQTRHNLSLVDGGRIQGNVRYSSRVYLVENLLTTFGVCFDKPITFYCDNISAIHMETNIIFHERTKPIGINYHVIRDKIVRDFVTTKNVSTKLQLVNVLT